MPTKVICCLCNRIDRGQKVPLAPREVHALRFARNDDRATAFLPFGKCSQCDALTADEQRALLGVFIKDLTVALLLADGHSPECAREARRPDLREGRNDMSETDSKTYIQLALFEAHDPLYVRETGAYGPIDWDREFGRRRTRRPCSWCGQREAAGNHRIASISAWTARKPTWSFADDSWGGSDGRD
jgi:hypothetical protein